MAKKETATAIRQKKLKRIKVNLTAVCREIIYLRDGYCCQWCGRPVLNHRNTHHIWRKSRYPHLRYDLLNLILFCFICHNERWHGDILEDGIGWFKKKYPARYDYLMKRQNEREQVKLEDLELLYEQLKQKLTQLQGESKC